MLYTHLEVQSQKPDQDEIHNSWHSASVAFPMNVAEGTSVKETEP
jgi:hypothetical protein